MVPTEISTLEVSMSSLNTTTMSLMTEDHGSSRGGLVGESTTSNHSSLSPSIHLYNRHVIPKSPTTTTGLTRTLSEGELSVYSAVSSVRDTMASARRTRESLRKSRVSLQALRREAEKTLQDARALRREMQQMLGRRDHTSYHDDNSSSRPTTYDSDPDSDAISSMADDESYP